MNVSTLLKRGFLAALALTLVVGCASAPKQEEPAAAQTATAEAQAAINEAKAAIAAAEAEGALWRDTASVLKEAEAALQAGDTARALELANRARRQAEDSRKQAAAEAQAQQQQAAAPTAMAGNGGYTVMRGDSLWRIAGKSEVYGNPYQWPLIYKANRDKIRDADLIFPGQVFAIKRDWNSAEVNAAVQHARTRGAWSLGAVEDSDRAYLAR